MSSVASRRSPSALRLGVLVALALGLGMHVVWTPVHLALSHQLDLALGDVGGQHVHTAHLPGTAHGHHDSGQHADHGGPVDPGEEREQDEAPGDHHHAGEHLLGLPVVRAGVHPKPLLAAHAVVPPVASRVACWLDSARPISSLAGRGPPPLLCTRGPPRA